MLNAFGRTLSARLDPPRCSNGGRLLMRSSFRRLYRFFFESTDRWISFPNSDRFFFESTNRWVFFLNSERIFLESTERWSLFLNRDRGFFESTDRWFFFLNSDGCIFQQSTDCCLFFLNTGRQIFVASSDRRFDWGRRANICGPRLPIQTVVSVLWIGVAEVGGLRGDVGSSWSNVVGNIQQFAQPVQLISAVDRAKREKLAPFRMLAQLDQRNTCSCRIRH